MPRTECVMADYWKAEGKVLYCYGIEKIEMGQCTRSIRTLGDAFA